MINPYYYLYFKIFTLTYKTNKQIVEWSSMIALSTLIYFNITSLIILTIPKEVVIQFRYFVFYGIGAFLLFINYFLFIYKNKHVRITNLYRSESKISRILGGTSVIIYILLTIWYVVYLVKSK